MARAGLATMRSATGHRNEPLVSRRTGQPVTNTFLWTRSPSSAVWHLAYADTGATLCGRKAQGAWLLDASAELPASAGRFPCSHCTRMRQVWYLP